jgi:glycosyltransferase involved in cell wall biosynthesis
MDFIVFSDDWGVHPSSCQHIFEHVARQNRVLWVNTVGMREPTLNGADAFKALAKLKRMATGQSASAPALQRKIEVIQPPMLPFPRSSGARRFNDWSVAAAANRAAASLGLSDPTVVTTVPTVVRAVERIRHQRLVYYRVDDFSKWPGLAHEVIFSAEQLLLRRADLVLATSKDLHESARLITSNALSFEHGVDIDLFANDSADELESLATVPRPRVGFFGLVDQRVDQKLVSEVASLRHDWAFVFAGPVAADVSKLSALRNVYFTGNVPYRSLPKLVRGLDCLMLPYVNDAFTKTISPLKLKEYMLSGLPIVSTPLPEVVDAGDLVAVTASPGGWCESINAAPSHVRAARRRLAIDLLKGQDWASRASDFVRLIAESGRLAPLSAREAPC